MNFLRVGFFLAVRQIRRSNIWTNALTIFIMTLTFLNLVFVTGILVGLIEGASQQYNQQFSGDVFITTLPSKSYIAHTPEIIATVKTMREIAAISPRYITSATVEANYQTRTNFQDAPDQVITTVAGIDPIAEQQVTGLKNNVFVGEYLLPNDDEYILIGSDLLEEYYRGFDLQGVLENVDVGSKVRVHIGNNVEKEFIVKGIVQTKVDDVIFRMYVTDTALKKLINRDDQNVGEIAIRLTEKGNADHVATQLKRANFNQDAVIETSLESQGAFLDDIRNTFGLLGNVIGSIGLIVAAITIFIIIFINAITRQKYIGILKGIGISPESIITAYMFQSFFYAIIGIACGTILIFTVLKPYFDAHPLDFPFSDGILLIDSLDMTIRALLLLLATIIAGFFPSWIIIRKNTLNAILGRND